MLILALLAPSILGLAQLPTPAAALTYTPFGFAVWTKDGVKMAPFRRAIGPADEDRQVVYKIGDAFAVWDDRGLSVRKGKAVKTSKLGEFALSPELLAAEEIEPIRAMMHRSERRRDVSGLSGSILVGNQAFFLARWEDSRGRTWLEALVSVDLADKKPAVQLVGKFQGFSTAVRNIDRALFPLNQTIACASRSGAEWGVATFDPNKGEFGYSRLGGVLNSFLLTRPGEGISVEQTSYGTQLVRRLLLGTDRSRILAEVRGVAKLVDLDSPAIIKITSRGKSLLRNLETAVEVEVPVECQIVRCASGILVWTGDGFPTRAWLYDPGRWNLLGSWSPPAPAPPN